jgi:capsular polysaccharide biosynthesis protein
MLRARNASRSTRSTPIGSTVEISGYLVTLRRWWWTLLVATWVTALAGLIVASSMSRVYEAEARLLVGPFNTDLNTQRASGQLTLTYSELVTSRPMLESVIAELGLDMDVEELREVVAASPNDVTRLLTIRVQGPDPQEASDIANALAAATDELASGASSVLRPEGEIHIVNEASPPTDPIAPQVSLIVLMAAAAGFVVAITIVLILDHLETRVRSVEDLSRVSMLPVLGRFVVPASQPGPAGAGITPARAAPVGAAGGAYRLLSARITSTDGPLDTPTILVQGTAIDDGSDAFAADLAAVLAERIRGVHLVTGQVSRSTASVAGPIWTPDPGEGADDPAGARRALVDATEALVIHAPSLETSSAGLDWAPLADVVVLVAARDVAERKVVAATAGAMRPLGARVVGSVLLRPSGGGTFMDRFRSSDQTRVSAERD